MVLLEVVQKPLPLTAPGLCKAPKAISREV